MAKTAVLLLNLGGPDSLEAVEPFLYNLFSDREIIKLPLQKPMARLISKLRSRKVKGRYQKIGGKSPITDITRRQAEALQDELGKDFKVFIGMRYWHPTIEEAVEEIIKEGFNNMVLLPLFPQYSHATTGSCIKELRRTVDKLRADLELITVESWHDHPAYLEALSEKVKEGLSRFEKNEVHLLFSAHALPKKFIDEGDPYLTEVKATIAGLIKLLGDIPWHLGFQSRAGPLKWLEPKTEEVIEDLARRGIKQVLIVPISFVSDHLETLYDIDVTYKALAREKGIALRRSPSLNDSPEFVSALAQIVRGHLQ
jgi:ferrochelatase